MLQKCDENNNKFDNSIFSFLNDGSDQWRQNVFTSIERKLVNNERSQISG